MKISRSLLERIREHGKQSYPEECCGILIGQLNGEEKRITEIVPLKNAVDSERKRRYLIPPDVYQKVDLEKRQRGLEILGFYHSHPDHPAVPSQFDVEHAWAWFSYLITEVEKGEPGEVTSWVLRDDRSRFEMETVEVVD